MLLNEHQSKTLFAAAGLPVPHGVLLKPEDIEGFTPDFDPPWFLKAQVLTGGRGKAGGIQKAETPEAFKTTAAKLFDIKIKGHEVPLLRVEGAAEFTREMYLSFSVSRESAAILFTVGRVGGVNIEEQDASNLLIQEIPVPQGILPHQIRSAFFHLDLEKPVFKAFSQLVSDLYAGVCRYGLLLAEINPLVLCPDESLAVLDGKVEIDDNVVDLKPDLERFYQPEHAAPEENTARRAGLSFHKLSGRVGLIANGAGLAMATMDLLNFSGLNAADFLDLGGGADEEQMKTAFSLLFNDPAVEAVLVNLFGGILSCRRVAEAMIKALDGKPPHKPMVVRLAGNEAEQGRALLKDLNYDSIKLCTELDEAMELLKGVTPPQQVSVTAGPPEIGDLEPPAKDKAPMPLRPHDPEILTALDADTPVLVQGATGKAARLHVKLMKEYGANIAAGVTPFKAGETVEGVPIYNTVRDAVREHDIQASVVFVPAGFTPDAVLEAADSRIPLTVCITEGVTQYDMLCVRRELAASETLLIGPNTPGVIVPGKTKLGIMPGTPFTPGPVAVLSRSGTLTYEAAARLTADGIGQSICVGIGGDPFIGAGFLDLFDMLRNHDETKAILVLGEIGGRAEEDLAEYVRAVNYPKPVLAYIAGRTAPPGKRLGHAGAVLDKAGSTDDKLRRMLQADFTLCPDPASIPEAARKFL